MASQNAEFIAIRKLDFEKLPKGVQDWVKRYFSKTDIFGEPCYAAFMTSGLAPHYRELVDYGVALVLLGPNEYTEDLPDEVRLMDWVRHSRKKGIFRFSVSWNDGNIEPVDDGD